MKPIEMAWNEYREMVVADDASEVQLNETKMAFFGGAAILFQALMIGLDQGKEPTEKDMQMMKNVIEELDEFGKAMDRAHPLMAGLIN